MDQSNKNTQNKMLGLRHVTQKVNFANVKILHLRIALIVATHIPSIFFFSFEKIYKNRSHVHVRNFNNNQDKNSKSVILQ